MLKGKVALITGASGGVGSIIAKRYAEEGAHVILLGRDLKRLEAVDDIIKVFSGESTIINMDLIDFEKISSLAASISNRFGKLDILVGNAAIITELGLLVDYTDEAWQMVFNTNFHANWQLIKHFDSLLKISDAGRAVFVGADIVAVQNKSFWGPYAISKVALESMVKIYAEETRHTKMRVNLVIPGPVATSIQRKSNPGKEPLPDNLDTDVFVKLASDDCHLSGIVHYAQF